ncbi:AI-2E family transporter [Arenivirga flava]|uniref:AI-2E family transporter n=1 Tax=Arenivirga flava TaxID=1930060 RepID=A0AA37UFP2_9MICO|nr:AI-2E family transporter [Arenivirga flava]GMA29613.1 AI-2E family transporter [Arenivirga flava]
MKINNAFKVGLLGGLGVLVALVIGGAVSSLATIITYIAVALFISLGLEPIISWLEKRRVPRWAAILIVLTAFVGGLVGFFFAVIPVIVNQTSGLIQQITDYFQSFTFDEFIDEAQGYVGDWVNLGNVRDDVVAFFRDPENIIEVGNGILAVGIAIGSGVFGVIVVLILTLYFTSSMKTIKRGLYGLVAASKRKRFIEISEQVTQAVGRYVVGQASLAACNGVLSFIFLSILGSPFAALLAFVAFLCSLVPLVGTITGSIIIVATTAFLPFPAVLWAAGYYLVYMQIEAYVLSPNIMNRAVKVPGAIVVIAALAGGTLAGVLGALVAIPVAASILIIVKQVWVPRQNEL